MNANHTRWACYTGYITQAIINNLAPLLFIIFQTQFAIPYELLGRLILLNFTTQLITDIVAVKVVDRTGYRPPMILAHVVSVLGLISLGLLPSLLPSPYLGLSIAVMLCAIGGGLLEVLVSPIVDALPMPEKGKAAAMSLLHSFYCWGQVGVVLGTTLILAVFGRDWWQLLPILWAIVPLLNSIAFTRVPLPATVSEEQRTKLSTLFVNPAFLAALLLMLCAGASELTMSQWSSLFAETSLGLPKVWGDIAGACLFGVFMGIGRIVYGFWGERIPLVPALIGCGLLAICSYLLTVFASLPMFSLLGCMLCGLAVSLFWPGTFSLAARRFPLGGAAMFGVLAVMGDAGAAFGPWLAGAVADSSLSGAGFFGGIGSWLASVGIDGLRAGLFVALIFPIAIVITAWLYNLGPKPQGEAAH